MKDKPFIVIGITGSIAAYKIYDLVVRIDSRVESLVLMTESATRFVSYVTLNSLIGNIPKSKLLTTTDGITQIDLANKMELLLVAPATANFIGKLANGITDDLLSTLAITILEQQKPCIIAPAMNTQMYMHPAIQKNLSTLKSFGYIILDSETGHLACDTFGKGKLANIDLLINEIFKALKI